MGSHKEIFDKTFSRSGELYPDKQKIGLQVMKPPLRRNSRAPNGVNTTGTTPYELEYYCFRMQKNRKK